MSDATSVLFGLEHEFSVLGVKRLFEFQRGGPVHAADFCGRVTAMWLRIRRW